MALWVQQRHQDLHEHALDHLHALHRFAGLDDAAARFCWHPDQAHRAAAQGLVYPIDGLDHTIVLHPGAPPAEAIRAADRPWTLMLHHHGLTAHHAFDASTTPEAFARIVTTLDRTFHDQQADCPAGS
ncbi:MULTISPECIES: hypothetical protein [unclassified Streptomyces]|uniref:hypothetical protein n=1 Tax=unclassified Streptomyces TaxID=2593676 RepID=UPI0029A00A73|nr:hypothetical protein [Streptomyces sp. DK15]MDX2395067.1 hypothetical protein [Streptomyces sp. DK15]